MTRIGLTLNQAKTSIRQARQERFDFPGYTFGPYRYRKDGHWCLGTGASRKSVSRVRQKIGEVLKPSNVQPWEAVRDQLNRVLRGWAAYFGPGTHLIAYRAVDHHVYTRFRLFLIRRHKVPSRGTGRYPDTEVFGALGVLRLRSIHFSSLS
jgi:RNA-directed DNA polymerase